MLPTYPVFFSHWARRYQCYVYFSAVFSKHIPDPLKAAEYETAHLQQLMQQDEEKFIEYLFRTYYASLCKTVYNITHDTDAAEDIVQDVFTKVWRKKEQLDLSKSVKSYLFRSSVNTALNYLEKNRRNTRMDETEVEQMGFSTNSTEEEMGYKEMNERVQQALTSLPPRCRTVFSLSRYEELSYAEIASQLDISVKAVEKHMGKALKHMRKYLQSFMNHSS